VTRTGVLAVSLVVGAVALGCGDPDGPPAQALASAAAIATASLTPAPLAALGARQPLAATLTDDASLERVVTTLRGDPDPDRRRRAIDAYARHVASTGASDEPLIEAVATDLDPLVRRWAALALASAPTPDLRRRMRLLAASERDPVVRSILERADVEHAGRTGHLGGSR